MIKPKEGVLTNIWMEQSILEIGRKIVKMDTELRLGLMGQSMRVIMNWVRNMELAHLNGQMAQYLLGNFTIIIFMEKVFTLGLIIENTKVSGVQTKCMEKEHSHGLTEGNILESMLMIRKKGTGNLIGQMADVIGVNGKMENNMEKGPM